jgi:proteasome lid subunit RPN8/RPN11
MSLVLTDEIFRQIEREGAASYPHECCGAMLGKDVGSGASARRIVSRLEPMRNSYAADEQYHRFSLDPRELMEIEKKIEGSGLAVLGFYHSHPDHPARPSETDRKNAWPYYSYAIVSIAKGQPADLTSWQLDEATEQFRPEEVVREEVVRESGQEKSAGKIAAHRKGNQP